MPSCFSGPVSASKPVAMTMMSSGYSLPPARIPFGVISSIGPSVLASTNSTFFLLKVSKELASSGWRFTRKRAQPLERRHVGGRQGADRGDDEARPDDIAFVGAHCPKLGVVVEDGLG